MTDATTKTHGNNTNSCGAKIPFDAISDPGCYICNWSGHLLRVPDDGVAPGRSPVVQMIGNETLFVTKLSDDAFVPVTKARLLASNCDICVNF